MPPPDSPDNKNFLREFSGHVNIALMVMFSLSTTAQIYSRMPGSTGRRFFGLYYFAALFLFALYWQIRQGIAGHTDAIAFETSLGLSLAWYAVHGIVRVLREARGLALHSHDPGYGILSRLYPALPVWLSTLLSDVSITLSLAVFYHLYASPIQRDFFAWIVLPSIILSQAWAQYRQAFLRQRFIDATAEASHYADVIGRR